MFGIPSNLSSSQRIQVLAFVKCNPGCTLRMLLEELDLYGFGVALGMFIGDLITYRQIKSISGRLLWNTEGIPREISAPVQLQEVLAA